MSSIWHDEYDPRVELEAEWRDEDRDRAEGDQAETDLAQEARDWIARNGMPFIPAVQSAIAFSDAHGDPRNENPFRHALIAEAAR